jgi:hypothetical protein
MLLFTLSIAIASVVLAATLHASSIFLGAFVATYLFYFGLVCATLVVSPERSRAVAISVLPLTPLFVVGIAFVCSTLL